MWAIGDLLYAIAEDRGYEDLPQRVRDIQRPGDRLSRDIARVTIDPWSMP